MAVEVATGWVCEGSVRLKMFLTLEAFGVDKGRLFCGNAGLVDGSGTFGQVSFPEATATTVLAMIISVWPNDGTVDGWARVVGIATECRDGLDVTECTGAAGAGLTGTDVAAGGAVLVGTAPFEKKLARRATVPVVTTGLVLETGSGRVAASADSALSKLSKLESAFSVNGDSVTP